ELGRPVRVLTERLRLGREIFERLGPHLAPPHHDRERARNLWIELGTGSLLDVVERGVGCPRGSIWKIGPERVEDVAYVDEAARIVAASRKVEVRISAAVDHHMMLIGDRRGEAELFVALETDGGAADRM